VCENWHWKIEGNYFLQIFGTLAESLKDENKKEKKEPN
jgi:hypothetical protein